MHLWHFFLNYSYVLLDYKLLKGRVLSFSSLYSTQHLASCPAEVLTICCYYWWWGGWWYDEAEHSCFWAPHKTGWCIGALRETCTFQEPHCFRTGIRLFHFPFGIQLPNLPILECVSRTLQAEPRVVKSTADPWDLSFSHGSFFIFIRGPGMENLPSHKPLCWVREPAKIAMTSLGYERPVVGMSLSNKGHVF